MLLQDIDIIVFSVFLIELFKTVNSKNLVAVLD